MSLIKNSKSKIKSMFLAGAALITTLLGGSRMAATTHADTVPQEHKIINNNQATQNNNNQATQPVKIYTVVAGDTLSKIAQNNNVSLQQLRQWNNKENTDLIVVGEKLYVSEPVIKTTTTTVTHTDYTNGNAQTGNTNNATQTGNTQKATQTGNSQQANTNGQGGSVYQQFIAAGGTPELWNDVVIPESGGNPNASNGQYHGLGQTNQSWGYGSVQAQTKGMLQYINQRFGGSIDRACQFHQQHSWW